MPSWRHYQGHRLKEQLSRASLCVVLPQGAVNMEIVRHRPQPHTVFSECSSFIRANEGHRSSVSTAEVSDQGIFLLIRRAPIARDTVTTAGNASGMAATGGSVLS